MRDEIDARIWNEHHQDFSDSIAAGIARAIEVVRVSVAALRRTQYDAPWRRKPRGHA